MDRVNSVLSNFNSIVDHMSKCINDRFIRIMKLCKGLNPNGDYYLRLVSKDKTWEYSFELYNNNGTWYVCFSYEDSCCSNDLPCKNYKDSIIGMTTAEVANFYSKPYEVIIYDLNIGWEEPIIRERV